MKENLAFITHQQKTQERNNQKLQLLKKIKYDYLENTIPQKQHFFFKNHTEG